MTTSRVRCMPSVLSATLLATVVPVAAKAKPYPVNVCVSQKQEDAGDYCRRVLKAWAAWDRDQDSTRRDNKIAGAAADLGVGWAKAEAQSSTAGVDCSDTTASASQMASQIDSATGAIVAAVNAGLDLADRSEARCGGHLLQAAARKCGRLLGAESDFVRNLARDAHGTRRAAARGRISENFTEAFNHQRRKGCPTAATGTGLESLVDDLVSAVVTNTTVSPNVSSDTFTTIPATGTTQYLGKSLTPICMNGTPYEFFVKRGSVNKLLVYYQGGGACWDSRTCSLPTCDNSVNDSDNPEHVMVGFGDQSNPSNPFRDWNVVFVSYCSCDVHFGDAVQDYPPVVQHRGYDNSRIVEKWAREHFVNPDQVFVTGSSAGAYGAWFNAPLHEIVWPASEFQVLADAGNGVITQDFLQNEFPHWDFEKNIPPTIPGVLESITEGTGIVGYTKAVTSFFPETRWAHYATAFDGGSGGQTGFYNIMLNGNNPLAALTWWNGSCGFNAKMRAQVQEISAAVPSNYRYYIGTGSRHTMWGSNKVYSDTTGGVPLLVDWVNAMLDGTPAWTNVEANDEGLLLAGDPRPPTIPTPPFFNVGSDVKVICNGGSPSGAFME
jgi:Pectinacetylesterase